MEDEGKAKDLDNVGEEELKDGPEDTWGHEHVDTHTWHACQPVHELKPAETRAYFTTGFKICLFVLKRHSYLIFYLSSYFQNNCMYSSEIFLNIIKFRMLSFKILRISAVEGRIA